MKEYKTRKNIRLEGYDYSKNGYYFVTICVKNRLKILGKIVGVAVHSDPQETKTFVKNKLNDVGVAVHSDPQIILTYEGKIAQKNIEKCNNIKNVRIDEYVIMPDHIHMIIELQYGSLWTATPTIPRIINSIKTIITKEIGYSIWQRNYYEHIIRNENEYFKIKEYIINNPYNWMDDEYY